MSENQHTTQIYTLIKDQEYSEAIKLLNFQLESNPRRELLCLYWDTAITLQEITKLPQKCMNN